MAPNFLNRRYCRDSYYNDNYYCDNYSPWYSYGRWIVLAAILVGAFLLFLLFACITARRRKRRGVVPYRGTGWAAGAQPGAPQAQWGAQPAQPYYGNNQAAPPYSPTANQGYNYNQTPGYGGANQGYFGGQQTGGGVELQQPDNAHMRGGEGVYAPPAGPPPGKTDGIVR